MKWAIFTIAMLVLMSEVAFRKATATTYANELKNTKVGLLYSDTDGDGISDSNDNCPYAYNPDQNDSDIPLNIVSYWKFDDGNGIIVEDSFGTHDGNLINGPVWTTGKVDGAISFDGINDYIESPTFPDLNEAITVAAWFKYVVLIPNMNTKTIVAKADNNGNLAGFTLHLKEITGGTPKVRFIINDDNGGRSDVLTEQIDINTWYFVAATYDGMHQNIYLNGDLVMSIENSGTINPAISNLLVGRSDDNHVHGPLYFNGLIDEVIIYNRALCPTEIEQHYQNGLKGHSYIGDGAGNVCDNCPDLYNPSQTDSDEDGIGNTCDEDCPNLDCLNPVNFADYSIFATDWQLTEPNLPGDLNKNGTIEVNDLGIIAIYWLDCCCECNPCPCGEP